jgi:hypothetical protein
MTKRLMVVAGLVCFALLCYGATVLVLNAVYDQPEIAAPSNPASGFDRVYMDSTTHKWTCLTSAGASCAPSGGGGGSPIAAIKQAIASRASNTASFSIASTAGNILVVILGWEGGAATASNFADTASTSYTKVVEHTGDVNENLAIFVGTVPATPGTLTFTATVPAGANAAFTGINVAEFQSGVTASVDTSAVCSDGSMNQKISLTPGISNAIIIEGIQSGQQQSLSLPSLGFSGILGVSGDAGGMGYSLFTPASGSAIDVSMQSINGMDICRGAVSLVQ